MQQFEGLRVIHRDRGNVETEVRVLRVHRPDRPIDDCERFQTEEIELHEPGGLYVVLVELRNEVGPAFFAIERCEVREFGRRYHHAAGVLAGVSDQSFQCTGQIDNRRDFLVFLVHAREFFIVLKRLVEGHAHFEGHLLGNSIDESIRMAEHSANVANDGLCRHRAVRDDLRHTITAVPFRYVFDDPVPALHAKIDIEVRHGDALGIEESFEQQVVLEWVQVRNTQDVGHQ